MSLINNADARRSAKPVPDKGIRLNDVVMSVPADQSSCRFIEQVSAQYIVAGLHRDDFILATAPEKHIVFDNSPRLPLRRPGMPNAYNLRPVASVRLALAKEVMVYQVIVQMAVGAQPDLQHQPAYALVGKIAMVYPVVRAPQPDPILVPFLGTRTFCRIIALVNHATGHTAIGCFRAFLLLEINHIMPYRPCLIKEQVFQLQMFSVYLQVQPARNDRLARMLGTPGYWFAESALTGEMHFLQMFIRSIFQYDHISGL